MGEGTSFVSSLRGGRDRGKYEAATSSKYSGEGGGVGLREFLEGFDIRVRGGGGRGGGGGGAYSLVRRG